MIGTAARLMIGLLFLPFVLFPGVNLIVGPIAVWCLVSAVRRIWRHGEPVS